MLLSIRRLVAIEQKRQDAKSCKDKIESDIDSIEVEEKVDIIRSVCMFRYQLLSFEDVETLQCDYIATLQEMHQKMT